jgi:IS605 OrfB family transposase
MTSTYRYVYNKAVEKIKNGHKPNFQSLRDMLVTENTKKGYEEYSEKMGEIKKIQKLKTKENAKDTELIVKDKLKELRNLMKAFSYKKNPLVQDFELETHKDIRACAVKSVCDAMKSGFTNLREGNIKFFNMRYKKKASPVQTIEMTPKCITMKYGKIKILPKTFGEECILKISKKNSLKYKDLVIENNVDIVKKNGEYYIHLLTKTKVKNSSHSKYQSKKVCGVDPGIRTLATVYSVTDGEISTSEYCHRGDLIDKLNKKIDKIKSSRKKSHFKGKSVRRKNFSKIEKQKKNIIDCVHWNTVNHLLAHNDVIYFGDIKSHDILRSSKNRRLNRALADIKLHLLKQRLVYKASLYRGKEVYFLNEAYTTKTCSSCGFINNHVGCNNVFNCPNCSVIIGRDLNASKNILMKGVLS